MGSYLKYLLRQLNVGSVLVHIDAKPKSCASQILILKVSSNANVPSDPDTSASALGVSSSHSILDCSSKAYLANKSLEYFFHPDY